MFFSHQPAGHVVLNDQRPTVLDILKQSRLHDREPLPRVVGSDSRHDRIETTQVPALQIVIAQQADVIAQMPQTLDHLVSRAHDVADRVAPPFDIELDHLERAFGKVHLALDVRDARS